MIAKNAMSSDTQSIENFGGLDDEEHSFGVTLDAEAIPQQAHSSMENKSVSVT
jgi:hypothetical protein